MWRIQLVIFIFKSIFYSAVESFQYTYEITTNNFKNYKYQCSRKEKGNN